ncbi:MAG: hypothetical protein ISS38_01890, partial [Candidatus Cloacimonetes bacterium]|nr:hypothetical protein [Candidatus Cloacimonadota bacterium]
MNRFSNSCYTAKNDRIAGSEKIENIAVSAILTNSYKDNKDILQAR